MSVQAGSDMLKKRLNLGDTEAQVEEELEIAKGENLPEYSLALLVLFAGGVPRIELSSCISGQTCFGRSVIGRTEKELMLKLASKDTIPTRDGIFNILATTSRL